MGYRRYQLGIDLGTTYTAAALCRDGGDSCPEPVPLATASAAVASVVFVAPDGSMLVGESAHRRALTDPRRIAREFKRRIGDGIPVVVGGEAYPADVLAARFVAWVVAEAAHREGGPPSAVAVTHPAEWGPHKRHALATALAAQGLEGVEFLSEPQAAAVGYAGTERIDPGRAVAVYDLGGGTFDAAVVRKLPGQRFDLLGRPSGIERLGGVDFDEQVLGHVRRVLGARWDNLDRGDPAVQTAVAGLRRECVAAKEGLSSDTEVMIPVMLPGIHTQVRLGRSEFEDMIRPLVVETVEAMRRALASAQVTPAELQAVLLVGGSSRIPLVSQLVSAELGRSVAVDADPKAVIAAGAALTARGVPAPVAEAVEPVPDEHPQQPPASPARVVNALPADTEAENRPRRRHTVLAAGIAVVAAVVMLVVPAELAPAISAGGAQPNSGAIDEWTGLPIDNAQGDAVTTLPGPSRSTAVAAAVPPVTRISPTGAAGATPSIPTPGVPAPAAPAAAAAGSRSAEGGPDDGENVATPDQVGDPLPAPGEALPAPGEALPAPGEALPAPGEALPPPGEALPPPGEALPPNDAAPPARDTPVSPPGGEDPAAAVPASSAPPTEPGAVP